MCRNGTDKMFLRVNRHDFIKPPEHPVIYKGAQALYIFL